MRAPKITDDEVIDAVSNSVSMSEAAKKLNIPFMSLKSRAQRLGIYNPASAGEFGWPKGHRPFNKIDLDEILDGKHPHYQTSKLRDRLVNEGVLEYRCSNCGIGEWLGNRIALELHHKDGNSMNHKRKNICFLCPNCHSQTDNHGGKNSNRY